MFGTFVSITSAGYQIFSKFGHDLSTDSYLRESVVSRVRRCLVGSIFGQTYSLFRNRTDCPPQSFLIIILCQGVGLNRQETSTKGEKTQGEGKSIMIRRPSFSFSRSAFLLAVLLHHQALFWQQGLCHATRTTPYADASIIEHSIKEVERNTAAVVMTMGVRDRQQMITPGAMIMGVPDKYRTKYLPMTSGSNTGTASATTSHVIASPSTSPPTITTPTPTASVSLPTEYASPESTSSYYTAAAEEGTIMMRMMKKRDMMSQMRMGKRPNDGKSSKSNNDMKTMKSEKREYDDETKGYYLHAPVPAHQGGTNTQPVGVRGRARSRGMAMSSTKSRPSKSSHSETARRMRNSLKDGGMMSSKNKSSKKRQNGLPPKGWETPVEVVHPPQMKVRQMRYSLGGKAGSKSKGLSSSSSSSSTKQSAKTSPSKKDLPPIQRRRYHGQKESTTKSSMSKSKGSSGSGMKMHWRYSMGKGKGKGFTRRPPTPSASPTPTFYPGKCFCDDLLDDARAMVIQPKTNLSLFSNPIQSPSKRPSKQVLLIATQRKRSQRLRHRPLDPPKRPPVFQNRLFRHPIISPLLRL